MRRLIVFLALVAALSFATYERHFAVNAGNMGLGVAAPTSKLEVAGTVSANSFIGSGAGLTNLPTVNNALTSNVAISMNATGLMGAISVATGNNIITITTSGNVGIGTTSPTQKLEVNGIIKTNSQFILSSASGTGEDSSFYNIRQYQNIAAMTMYPSGTLANIGSTFAVVPKGSGLLGNLSQIVVFATDIVATPANL